MNALLCPCGHRTDRHSAAGCDRLVCSCRRSASEAVDAAFAEAGAQPSAAYLGLGLPEAEPPDATALSSLEYTLGRPEEHRISASTLAGTTTVGVRWPCGCNAEGRSYQALRAHYCARHSGFSAAR